MIHEEAAGRLFVLEKVYEWLLEKLGGSPQQELELNLLCIRDYAWIVAKNNFDIEQIDLSDGEEYDFDFWVGAHSEWTEFRDNVETYRKQLL